MAGRHSLSDREGAQDFPHDDVHANVSRPVGSARDSTEATEWLPGWERLDPGATTSAIAAAVGLGSTGRATASSARTQTLPPAIGGSSTGIAAPERPERPKEPAVRQKPGIVARMVGVLGELLITAGIFIGLFIVWQVWWTDLAANRHQSERISAETKGWSAPPTQSNKPVIGKPRQDPPPPVAHSTTVGDFEGIIRIPRFGKDYQHTIEYGTSLEKVLDKGAFGHYEQTAYPGEVGNFAIAAHRQSYGAPMKNVGDLEVGDAVVVETPDAYLVYYVTSDYLVPPDSVQVVAPVPNEPEKEATERIMTITTCHPPFISNERWIVHAKYDHWVARSDGVPQELVEDSDG